MTFAPLAPGEYTIQSTTRSSVDGDVDRQTLTFTVAEPTPPRRRPRRRRPSPVRGRIGGADAQRPRPTPAPTPAPAPTRRRRHGRPPADRDRRAPHRRRAGLLPPAAAGRVSRRLARAAGAGAGLAIALLALPAGAAAHALSKSFESRLPLAVYLAGAGGAVALSFLFVLVRDVRAEPPPAEGRHLGVPAPIRYRAPGDRPRRPGPGSSSRASSAGSRTPRCRALRLGLRLGRGGARLGLRLPDLDVARPVHDAPRPRRAGDAGGRDRRPRAGRLPRGARALAGRGRRSPPSSGSSSSPSGAGSRTLALVITGYTVFTLAMMAQYGRDTWREHGEVFSVWFGLIGRLAPLAPVAERRPGASGGGRSRSGLLESGWAARATS